MPGSIHVPGDYPSIQQAIDVSCDGDTVEVHAMIAAVSRRWTGRDKPISSQEFDQSEFQSARSIDVAESSNLRTRSAEIEIRPSRQTTHIAIPQTMIDVQLTDSTSMTELRAAD